MPWDDFLELLAFNSISPISDDRADSIAAIQTTTLGNLIRGAVGATGEGLKVADFLPFKREKAGIADDDCLVTNSGEEEDAAIDRILGMCGKFKRG